MRSAIKHYGGEELDIKSYETDMRHLINTYIQAEPAQALGDLAELLLTQHYPAWRDGRAELNALPLEQTV